MITVPVTSLDPLVATDDVAAAFPVGAVVGERMPTAMAAAVPLKVGDGIRGNWKGQGSWYPASVLSVDGVDGGIVAR